MTNTPNTLPFALNTLRMCRTSLRFARLDAGAPARAARASELTGKIADALCHCERLAFVTEADIRSDAHQDALDE